MSNGYIDRVKAAFLARGTEDMTDWVLDSVGYSAHGSVCQACGHNPIKRLYFIRNEQNGAEMVVGSECVWKRFHISLTANAERQLKNQINGLRQAYRREQRKTGETTSVGWAPLEWRLRAAWTMVGERKYWSQSRRTMRPLRELIEDFAATLKERGFISKKQAWKFKKEVINPRKGAGLRWRDLNAKAFEMMGRSEQKVSAETASLMDEIFKAAGL